MNIEKQFKVFSSLVGTALYWRYFIKSGGFCVLFGRCWCGLMFLSEIDVSFFCIAEVLSRYYGFPTSTCSRAFAWLVNGRSLKERDE